MSHTRLAERALTSLVVRFLLARLGGQWGGVLLVVGGAEDVGGDLRGGGLVHAVEDVALGLEGEGDRGVAGRTGAVALSFRRQCDRG